MGICDMEREQSLIAAVRLRNLRKSNKLSHVALSSALKEKYSIEISRDSLMNYEISDPNNQRAYKNKGMRIEYLYCFSDFYQVSADWLLGLTDNPHREPQDGSVAALYHAALDKWGADAQTAMCVEEMSELTKELCKWKRGKDNFNEIAEEIADVEIMLEQMKLLHNVSALVETVKVYKRSRLRERVEEE